MASSPAAVGPVEYDRYGFIKPTDGGEYLDSNGWFCVVCGAFAAESHLTSANHLKWVQAFVTGQFRPRASIQDMVLPGNAPPPPPGQPTDDRPGPPPAAQPRDQARTAEAVREESMILRDAKLAIILEKLHTKLDMILTKVGAMEARFDKLDMILTKVGAMEARLDKLERKIDAWSNWG